jgi:hypothetical protein
MTCDFFPVRLHREVAGIRHVDLDVFEVACIGSRSFRRKDEVVLAPDDQRGRLILTEECLELWIQRKLRAVVQHQIGLDFVAEIAAITSTT